jgi:hypothetical protein
VSSLALVSVSVAGGAAEFKFVDDGVAGVFICGNVTELEQRLTFAVNTDPIAFLDDPFLAIRRMALFHSSVKQAGLRIMNQNPNKRCRDQRGDNRFRDWNAIVRGAAITANMEHHLGGHVSGSFGERVCVLLSECWPCFGGVQPSGEFHTQLTARCVECDVEEFGFVAGCGDGDQSTDFEVGEQRVRDGRQFADSCTDA